MGIGVRRDTIITLQVGFRRKKAYLFWCWIVEGTLLLRWDTSTTETDLEREVPEPFPPLAALPGKTKRALLRLIFQALVLVPDRCRNITSLLGYIDHQK